MYKISEYYLWQRKCERISVKTIKERPGHGHLFLYSLLYKHGADAGKPSSILTFGNHF